MLIICFCRRPFLRLGLAFVAWTRAQCWERMAFQKLPPIEDFVAARLTRDFEARSAFEAKADEMCMAYLTGCWRTASTRAGGGGHTGLRKGR